jgi:hypothetical protein
MHQLRSWHQGFEAKEDQASNTVMQYMCVRSVPSLPPVDFNCTDRRVSEPCLTTNIVAAILQAAGEAGRSTHGAAAVAYRTRCHNSLLRLAVQQRSRADELNDDVSLRFTEVGLFEQPTGTTSSAAACIHAVANLMFLSISATMDHTEQTD